jgi:hypothetical protein
MFYKGESNKHLTFLGKGIRFLLKNQQNSFIYTCLLVYTYLQKQPWTTANYSLFIYILGIFNIPKYESTNPFKNFYHRNIRI